MTSQLIVNGQQRRLDVDSDALLLNVLRNDLGLTGAKSGCGLEQCGACVVLVDGEPVHSCTTRIGDLSGAAVETLEGLGEEGQLDPLQAAFFELNAAQCGYCLAGIIMRAKALLAANPSPSRTEICAALDDHLCRCGAQPRIIKAVERAALAIQGAQR